MPFTNLWHFSKCLQGKKNKSKKKAIHLLLLRPINQLLHYNLQLHPDLWKQSLIATTFIQTRKNGSMLLSPLKNHHC